MNAGLQNIFISLGAMQLARKIPFDDPVVLNYVRVGYITSQIIILGTYFYVSYKVKQKNDQTVLKYGTALFFFFENTVSVLMIEFLRVVRLVDQPSPMSPNSGGLVTTTVRDYDLSETSKLLRAVYFGIAMMTFFHFYLKYTQPSFVQALMGLKNLYDAKPVAIHIFGKPADGDLKRPWKVQSMLGVLQRLAGPKRTVRTITEAEKKVGTKKED
ncbi:inorganic phosphate transporter [Pisolithus marmoratus]|nr:inorganic phosphate transporter [Pisolithus marmoratus]